MLLCIRFGKQKMKSRWNWDRNIVRCVVCNRRVSRDHNCSFFVLFQNVEAPISNIEDQEGDREDNSGVLVNDIDILDSRQCSFQRRSAFFELRQESRLASFFHSWTARAAGWPPKAGGWTATTTRGWVAAVNAKARWEIVGHIASRPSSLGTAEAISYAWNGRHAQVLQFNDFFVVVFSCKNTIQIRIHLSTYRVSRQKEYTFDDLWGGRSARYSARKYLKLTAHSSSFERGALELDTMILRHAMASWKSRF